MKFYLFCYISMVLDLNPFRFYKNFDILSLLVARPIDRSVGRSIGCPVNCTAALSAGPPRARGGRDCTRNSF